MENHYPDRLLDPNTSWDDPDLRGSTATATICHFFPFENKAETLSSEVMVNGETLLSREELGAWSLR